LRKSDTFYNQFRLKICLKKSRTFLNTYRRLCDPSGINCLRNQNRWICISKYNKWFTF